MLSKGLWLSKITLLCKFNWDSPSFDFRQPQLSIRHPSGTKQNTSLIMFGFDPTHLSKSRVWDLYKHSKFFEKYRKKSEFLPKGIPLVLGKL